MELELKSINAATKAQKNTQLNKAVGRKIERKTSTNIKHRQQENLKRLLTQLTAEMRQKYSLSQHDIQHAHGNVKIDRPCTDLGESVVPPEKNSRKSETQGLLRNKQNHDIFDNQLLISEPGIIDSCGIVSQPNSVESNHFEGEGVIRTELLRDQEEGTLSFPSHERPTSKKTFSVNSKKGLIIEDNSRRKEKASFNQEEVDNKCKLG